MRKTSWNTSFTLQFHHHVKMGPAIFHYTLSLSCPPIICPFQTFLVLKIVHHGLFLSCRKESFYIMGVQWEGPERHINQIVYWGGSYNKYQQSLTASFLLKQKLKQPQLYFFMEILLNYPCNSKWYPSKWNVAKVYHSFILSITFSMFDSI